METEHKDMTDKEIIDKLDFMDFYEAIYLIKSLKRKIASLERVINLKRELKKLKIENGK